MQNKPKACNTFETLNTSSKKPAEVKQKGANTWETYTALLLHNGPQNPKHWLYKTTSEQSEKQPQTLQPLGIMASTNGQPTTSKHSNHTLVYKTTAKLEDKAMSKQFKLKQTTPEQVRTSPWKS
jgi:hypothetical protein